MTTEGSTEVPAGEGRWSYRRPFIMDASGVVIGRVLTRPNDQQPNAAADDARGEQMAANINGAAERTELAVRLGDVTLAYEAARNQAEVLEARLAEVEAERDEAREELCVMRFALDGTEQRLTALRAVVRPLVEALGGLMLALPNSALLYEGVAAATIHGRAALAHPAIAALLDQQKEHGNG